MDDDLTFGASVWGSTDGAPLSPSPVVPKAVFLPQLTAEAEDNYDEFDDFDEAAPSVELSGHDDDFGDFGDFGDPEALEEVGGFNEGMNFGDVGQLAGPSLEDWEPLRLHPTPSRSDLQTQVDQLVAPLFAHDDISAYTTTEDLRQAEGVSQVLVNPESRALYRALLQAPPPAAPPNWTRSRVRRQHLISLGIPVNLDEVLPRSTANPLPALKITTRPMSAPPGPRNNTAAGSSGLRGGASRAGTPQPSGRGVAGTLGLGPKPELDEGKISGLLDLASESLTLLPVAALEAHLHGLRTQTAQATMLLTHLLQTRDALQQDSETYNKLIGELVGEAQKMKSGKLVRKGSGMA